MEKTCAAKKNRTTDNMRVEREKKREKREKYSEQKRAL